jgi:L-asparaginase II
VESGAADHFGFSDEELAVICASHSGETRHVAAVRSVLAKIGLAEEALQCGTHWPLDLATTQAMLRRGEGISEVHCNCSGKHSGMLALCRYYGWDIADYTALWHPLQQMLLGKVAEVTTLSPGEIAIGVDGCGVPVHGMSVFHMALAFARLAKPVDLPEATQEAAKRVIRAMTAEPFMVAGTNRFCSELMRVGRGQLFSKGGAEGVYCVGIPSQGLGIAMKTEDGHDHRGPAPVITDALQQLGMLNEEQVAELKALANPILRNHRQDVVGEVKSVLRLQSSAQSDA